MTRLPKVYISYFYLDLISEEMEADLLENRPETDETYYKSIS